MKNVISAMIKFLVSYPGEECTVAFSTFNAQIPHQYEESLLNAEVTKAPSQNKCFREYTRRAIKFIGSMSTHQLHLVKF